MPIDGDSCMEIPGDCEVVKAADAQATIAALEQRVKELKQWVQDQSTANLETMRHMDEMQSRAMDAESQLTQRTAELERVRDQYADLRKMVLALPKVEGEIELYTGKNTNQVVVTDNHGVIIGTLYGLDHAKPVAALYKRRQGME